MATCLTYRTTEREVRERGREEPPGVVSTTVPSGSVVTW
jgi:hypothetical protein